MQFLFSQQHIKNNLSKLKLQLPSALPSTCLQQIDDGY
jgi:hypothetical protein